MDIISLILIAMVSSVVVPFVIGFIDGYSDRTQADSLKEKLNTITHIVKEEIYNSRTYWFDAENDKFLVWGDSQDELISTLKAKWPEHIFYLNKTQEILCQPNWIPMPFSINK